MPVERPSQGPELSHWAGSAAEEVPHMSGRDPRQGDETWSGYDARPPLAGRRPARRPDQSGQGWGPPGGARPDRWRTPDRPTSRRCPTPRRGGRSSTAPPAGGQRYEQPYGDTGYGDEAGYTDDGYDVYDDEVYDEPAAGFPDARRAGGPPVGTAPRRGTRRAPDRDLRTAVLVGVGVPRSPPSRCSRCSVRSAG